MVAFGVVFAWISLKLFMLKSHTVMLAQIFARLLLRLFWLLVSMKDPNNAIESSIEDSKEANETSQLSSVHSGGEESSQRESSSGKHFPKRHDFYPPRH